MASTQGKVPGKGDCLLQSVVAAYLCASTAKFNDFATRFRRLFGDQSDTIKLQLDCFSSLRNYNASNGQDPFVFDDPVMRQLVNILRNRVVNLVCDTDCFRRHFGRKEATTFEYLKSYQQPGKYLESPFIFALAALIQKQIVVKDRDENKTELFPPSCDDIVADSRIANVDMSDCIEIVFHCFTGLGHADHYSPIIPPQPCNYRPPSPPVLQHSSSASSVPASSFVSLPASSASSVVSLVKHIVSPPPLPKPQKKRSANIDEKKETNKRARKPSDEDNNKQEASETDVFANKDPKHVEWRAEGPQPDGSEVWVSQVVGLGMWGKSYQGKITDVADKICITRNPIPQDANRIKVLNKDMIPHGNLPASLANIISPKLASRKYKCAVKVLKAAPGTTIRITLTPVH